MNVGFFIWLKRMTKIGVKELLPALIIPKEFCKSKYETEKYIAVKANKISQFKRKWEVFEVFN